MKQTTILPEHIPDMELIERILAGEKSLFEYIIRRYNQRLFRIGMSVLNNDMDVEDAMQNTYVNAFEHLGTFGNRSSVGTWLVRILLNECIAQKKKLQRFNNTDVDDHLEKLDTMKTPANILLNKELGSALEHAIAQLPEKYRLVFVLREVEKLSVKETGDALAIEAPNVKVRLNRAKTILRENLGNYLNEHLYSFHLTRCDRIVKNVFAQLQLS